MSKNGTPINFRGTIHKENYKELCKIVDEIKDLSKKPVHYHLEPIGLVFGRLAKKLSITVNEIAPYVMEAVIYGEDNDVFLSHFANRAFRQREGDFMLPFDNIYIPGNRNSQVYLSRHTLIPRYSENNPENRFIIGYTDENGKILRDINKIKELNKTTLNGSHTFCKNRKCPLIELCKGRYMDFEFNFEPDTQNYYSVYCDNRLLFYYINLSYVIRNHRDSFKEAMITYYTNPTPVPDL